MTRFPSRPSALATRALLLAALFASPRTGSAQELPPPSGASTFNSFTTLVVPPVATPPRDWFGQRPWGDWTSITGDWNGTRSDLRDAGFDIAVSAKLDTSLASSIAPSARGLVTTELTLDTSKTLHARGGTVGAQLQAGQGTDVTALLGVTQSVSNIDASVIPTVAQIWYEQPLGAHARVKAGRIDANTEFAYVDAASEFLSASMGFSPSITYMPSYPMPVSGAVAEIRPGAGVEVRGGMFDGTAGDGDWLRWDSRFAIGQVGKSWGDASGTLAGRVSAGAWRYSSGNGDDQTGGLFVTTEQNFLLGDKAAAAFVQAGASDSRSAIQRHIGAGFTLGGLVPAREGDTTGLAATWIRMAPGSDSPTELAIELFHRIALTPAFGLVPDVQWIRRPEGSGGRTLVFTIRLHVEL